MTSRLTTCIVLLLGLVSVAVAVDLAILPQNVLVTNMSAGPERGQVTLFLEWDRPKQLLRSPPTVYQLGRSCAFTFTAPDQLVGTNSGLMQMTGPGPHYRVAAVCNCNRGKVALFVRVYNPIGEYVSAQTVPDQEPIVQEPIVGKLNWLIAPCAT